jgi:hypothetical protein
MTLAENASTSGNAAAMIMLAASAAVSLVRSAVTTESGKGSENMGGRPLPPTRMQTLSPLARR